MSPRFSLLLPATCALLFCLILPANAFVVVIGNQLAHDCYLMAKARVDLRTGLKTCNLALENEPLSPHDRAGTYVNRGAIKFLLGQYDDALNDDDVAIGIQADLADAYVDRAGALIMMKRFDEAMADVNHGIELGPSALYVGYYNRAVAQQLQGKYKEAYFDYRKALELEPNFTAAAERLKDFVVTRTPVARIPGG